MLRSLKASIPKLPYVRKHEYIRQYGISSYDAEMIVSMIGVADLFEKSAELTAHTKTLTNLIISEVFRYLEPDDDIIPFTPGQLASLAEMLGAGRLNAGTAKQILKEIAGSGIEPEAVVKERGLEQISDAALLSEIVREVVAENPKSVSDYRRGKTAALQSLIGKAMAKTSGRGNPVMIRNLLEKEL